MPNPSFQRTLSVSKTNPLRKPSVVELLSSPPALQQDYPDEVNSFLLSRNDLISSKNGLDWSEVKLYNLTELNKLISIDTSYLVQQAFETLLSNNLTSVPVSTNLPDKSDLTNCLTFDYSDLNVYLLLIMNKISLKDLNVEEKNLNSIQALINKGKTGGEVPVEIIIKLNPKNPFIKFQEEDNLGQVMETLGNGVHRVAIIDDSMNITGILSQRRMIKYLWENARRFNSLEYLFNSTLAELKIGSSNPITIYEDQPLIEALNKMYAERVTSLAVIDRSKSLIGNISIVDVKNVTSSKNSHLLFKTVLNFISYNLTQKGIEEGQDQFPIFHVNNSSSLGRVIAKLVATQSHRLWIVEPARQSVSVNSGTGSISSPPTPTTIETALNHELQPHHHHHHHESPNHTPGTPTNTPNNGGIGSHGSISDNIYGLPGKLIGVVSLTDILGLFAASKGRKTDPTAARNQRRRSSTSTTRSSMDSSMSIGGGVSISGPTLQHTNSNSDAQDIFRKSYTKDSGFK
jgi:CBS domain-containing protein